MEIFKLTILGTLNIEIKSHVFWFSVTKRRAKTVYARISNPLKFEFDHLRISYTFFNK